MVLLMPWTAACLLLAAKPLSAVEPAAPMPLTLNLGITEDVFTTAYQEELKPIMSYLAEYGVVINPVRLADPAALSEGLARGGIDIGIFTPVTYVRAHAKHPDLQPFASHAINGTRFSLGYVVVRADSRITSLAELKGKRFAYTDPESFGGYLYPRYALMRAGIDPEKLFASTVLTGDYLESLRKLFTGEVDGAAVLDEVLRVAEPDGLPRQQFRVLSKSRRVPYMAYVARPTLPRSTIDHLRTLLTGHRFKTLYLHVRGPFAMPGPWARVLQRRNASWAINGFVTASDGDFNEVRRMLQFVDTWKHP